MNRFTHALVAASLLVTPRLPLVISAFSAFSASSVSAQRLTYEELIRQAVIEFDASHWEEARVLFKRAHEENPSARTWRGMGITAFELRRYVDAVAELEAALADPRKPLTEQQRTEVQSLLQRAREFVSVYRVRVQPGSAEVRVDGEAASIHDGQIFLDPGRHVLTVRAPGYTERRAELKVDAGERDEVVVELEVANHDAVSDAGPIAPVLTEHPPVRVEVAPAPSRRKRPITWTLLGSAIAVLPAAIVMRRKAVSASQELDGIACTDTDAGCLRHADSVTQKGERQERVSAALFAVSGALLGGAIVGFVLEGRARSSNTSISVGPRYVGLSHRF